MDPVSIYEIIGVWVSIFLTLTVFSFLYDDNPIYKLSEHIFMGVTIGYGISESYWGVFKPNLLDKLFVWEDGQFAGESIYFLALLLCVLLLFKATSKWSWLARIPIAILVSAYAALKITGETTAKLMLQLQDSMPDLHTSWNRHGIWDWSNDGAGVFSDTFLVISLMAILLHFYFSKIPSKTEKWGYPLAGLFFVLCFIACFFLSPLHDSLIGSVIVSLSLASCAAMPFLAISPARKSLSRFGVWVLMLSFGASFGFTVMGRVSLAIGRAQELLGHNMSTERAEQVMPQTASFVSLLVIAISLFWWSRRKKDTEIA